MPFILVISLNNDEGQKRRDKLNFPFIHIQASDGSDVPEWMTSKYKCMHNLNKNTKQNKLGCLYSHYKALRYIIDNKINDVIVCEDDVILKDKRSLENLKHYKSKLCPILLSGEISHPKCWKKNREWIKNNNVVLDDGLNPIDYQEFRFFGTESIYYQNYNQALDISDLMLFTTKLSAYDMFLSKQQKINSLIYPSLFKTYNNLSQITNTNEKERDNYNHVNYKYSYANSDGITTKKENEKIDLEEKYYILNKNIPLK
tara:strand:+ start:3408 stop:4181 length:774 start_codon:yes stop_codon:yes gene_type:complete